MKNKDRSILILWIISAILTLAAILGITVTTYQIINFVLGSNVGG